MVSSVCFQGPPVKVKKYAKKAKAKPLATKPTVNQIVEEPGILAPGPAKKTVEEMYQKKTQLEHILLRPDTVSFAVLRRMCSNLTVPCVGCSTSGPPK